MIQFPCFENRKHSSRATFVGSLCKGFGAQFPQRATVCFATLEEFNGFCMAREVFTVINFANLFARFMENAYLDNPIDDKKAQLSSSSRRLLQFNQFLNLWISRAQYRFIHFNQKKGFA